MKNQMKFFLCLFILIAITSCTKEIEINEYQNPYADLTGAEYLKTYDTPEIMFHYAEVHKTSQHTQGLLISNFGQVYAYSANKPMNDLNILEIHTSTMVNLLTHSVKVDKKVDLDQLVDHYKLTRKVNVTSTNIAEKNEAIDTYFVAYDVTYDTDGTETCSSVGVSSHKSVQKILKSSKRINTSIQAEAIVAWMAKVLDKSAS
jgi:hypothetical protein